jgi:hypothetical protein
MLSMKPTSTGEVERPHEEAVAAAGISTFTQSRFSAFSHLISTVRVAAGLGRPIGIRLVLHYPETSRLSAQPERIAIDSATAASDGVIMLTLASQARRLFPDLPSDLLRHHHPPSHPPWHERSPQPQTSSPRSTTLRAREG